MNVLCTGNSSKEKFAPIIRSLITLFKDFPNHSLYIDIFNQLEEFNKLENLDKIYKPKNNIDFVICIGGDGAILSAIRRMDDNQLPILGIHIGNLGFLNKMNSNNYISLLRNILNSRAFKYDNKALIVSSFKSDDNKDIRLTAFNEIFISRTEISRLLTVEVFINDELLNNYSCDGLIVSTPMGSTAYSLSAGGPIVSPLVNCIILTPVSPHTLSSRPIIINDSYNIKINAYIKDDKITISSDGQVSKKINNNTSIYICKSQINAKLISFMTEDSYYKKLRDNLGWNR